MTNHSWLLLLVCLFGIPHRAHPYNAPLSDWMQGSTNHFGGPQDGSIDPFNPLVLIGGCSYGELDPRSYPHYNILSVHPDSDLALHKSMNGCGSCYEIQCSDAADRCNNGPFTNSVVAMIGGTCLGGCSGTHVNLHVFAFDQLAPIRLGNIKIRLRQVECTPVEALAVKVKTYRVEAGGYIKLVVRNVPGDGGLRAVEIRGSREGGSWQPAENGFGAAWEASVLPNAPLDLRLTSTKGEQVVLREIIKTPGFVGEVVSNSQFTNVASDGVNPSAGTLSYSPQESLYTTNGFPFQSQTPAVGNGSPYPTSAAPSVGTIPVQPTYTPSTTSLETSFVLQFPQLLHRP